MKTQSEALHLAAALDSEFTTGRISNDTGRKAAAELRRLSVENDQLTRYMDALNDRCVKDTALIGELVKALEAVVHDWTEQFERYGHMAPSWCKKARAAIAAYQSKQINQGE